MTYTNITQIPNLAAQSYFDMPGYYSHSWLKNQKGGISEYFPVTDKMKLGGLVDALLTQSAEVDYNSPLITRALVIASSINKDYGWLISPKHGQVICQPSYTGEINVDVGGSMFTMPVKGRLDWLLQDNGVVIDLKVTAAKDMKGFMYIIDKFGYKNQLWHYARLSGATKAYLLVYSDKVGRVIGLLEISVNELVNEFWFEAVKVFGSIKEMEVKNGL